MERYMKGMSAVEISKELQISPELVSLDLKHIREESRQALDEVIQKTLPLQWTKTRMALQFIQKKALEIFENTKTDSTKLASLSLFSEAQRDEFTVVMDSNIINDAIKLSVKHNIDELLTHYKEKENKENVKNA